MPGFKELFGAILGDGGSYESRKVALMEKSVCGIAVSTAYTSDCGYETALLDKKQVNPVERYKSREEAVAGHEKWCAFVNGGERKVKMLGYPPLVEDHDVVLEDDF